MDKIPNFSSLEESIKVIVRNKLYNNQMYSKESNSTRYPDKIYKNYGH